MKRWLDRFNIILCIGGLAIGGAACKSTGDKPTKKPVSVMRVHLQSRMDDSKRSEAIEVFRQNPVKLVIEESAFLNELHVKSAEVVETAGVFSVSIQFNRQGSWLLEQYTSANRNRSLAIFATFGSAHGKPPKVTRWLAAPMITKRITDGKLVFTPDADRAEADLFVLGLSNTVERNKGYFPEE